jgi:hypothetical protein
LKWAIRAFPKILYRIWMPVALAACLMTASFGGAQEDRAQVPFGVRGPAKKKDSGPRALAVLRLAADGKVSLVPIAILINGKFWDATAYKADPIPMALEPGTVYEGERGGNSVGLFTVGSALHSNAKNAPTPWLGTGAWSPGGNEKPPPQVVAKAEGVPVGIDNGDAPPRLTKDPAKVHTPADSPGSGSGSGSASGTASGSPSGSASTNASAGGASSSESQPVSGDGPPRLKKPGENQSPSSSPTASAPASGTGSGSGSGSGSTSSDGPPRLSKPAEPASDTKKPDAPGDPKSGDPKSDASKTANSQAADSVAASDSGADEGNRPRLRRAKPTQAFSDQDFPGYSKPGKHSSASGKIVAVAAATGPVQLIPAISDAGGPPPHSFAFDWLKDEEGERRQQVIDLAKQELRAYAAALAKAQIAATPSPTGRRKVTAKLPEPKFGTVQMVTYDLWTNNQPVIVFSAKAQLPSAGGAQASPNDPEYSILLVTYPDIYNNLHKIYSAVTDQHHLDVTPRFELIDAVDADGDGRGELLFQKTTDQGTGWVIFRASADSLWKMFDSLNPE